MFDIHPRQMCLDKVTHACTFDTAEASMQLIFATVAANVQFIFPTALAHMSFIFTTSQASV
jgi:hypothetical protein